MSWLIEASLRDFPTDCIYLAHDLALAYQAEENEPIDDEIGRLALMIASKLRTTHCDSHTNTRRLAKFHELELKIFAAGLRCSCFYTFYDRVLQLAKESKLEIPNHIAACAEIKLFGNMDWDERQLLEAAVLWASGQAPTQDEMAKQIAKKFHLRL